MFLRDTDTRFVRFPLFPIALLGAVQRGSTARCAGPSEAQHCALLVGMSAFARASEDDALSSANGAAELMYPAGGTRIAVRRWRDMMEARALVRKCGPALGTHRTPMRLLTEQQRSANMQLQGLLLTTLEKATVLRDRFIAEQRRDAEFVHHGDRLLNIMSRYYRVEAQEELAEPQVI